MTKTPGEAPAVTGDLLDKGGRVLLTREAILAVQDVVYEYVDVPEWGGTIRMRSMTGTERDGFDAESYRASQAGADPLANFRSRRIAACIVDDDGVRLFTDDDIAALGAKNGGIIDRLDDIVVRLSGIKDGAVAQATADLKAAPSAGSGSV